MKLQEQLEKVQKDLEKVEERRKELQKKEKEQAMRYTSMPNAEKGEGITNQNRIGNRKRRGEKE